MYTTPACEHSNGSAHTSRLAHLLQHEAANTDARRFCKPPLLPAGTHEVSRTRVRVARTCVSAVASSSFPAFPNYGRDLMMHERGLTAVDTAQRRAGLYTCATATVWHSVALGVRRKKFSWSVGRYANNDRPL